MKELIIAVIVTVQLGLGVNSLAEDKATQQAVAPVAAPQIPEWQIPATVPEPIPTPPPAPPAVVNAAPAAPAVVKRPVIADEARAVMIVDDHDNVLFSKNAYQPTPLASVTKLMTALVFLDHNPGWDKVITIKSSDSAEPARLETTVGDQIKVKDLFYAALVGSKNNAAKALARSTGLSSDAFVAAMNKKALDLGMSRAHFVDPTGLNPKNEASAQDAVLLAEAAFKNKDIDRATNTKQYVVKMVKAKTNKKYTIKNTNDLLGNGIVLNGKTGFIDEAGYNVIVRAKKGSQVMIAIVFGAKAESKRFEIAQALLNQAFSGKLTIASAR